MTASARFSRAISRSSSPPSCGRWPTDSSPATGWRSTTSTGFVCHPGGAKVVTALEQAFGLRQGALAGARGVLRDYGNMSAATVIFVLERMLAETPHWNRALMNGARPRFHRRVCGARQSVTPLYWTLGLVVSAAARRTRLGRRNTARLRRLGAIEIDAGGYPLFRRAACRLAREPGIAGAGRNPAVLAVARLFALLQPARIWVILSLGRFWTTRMLVAARGTACPSRPIPLDAPSELPDRRRRDRHLPLAFGAVAIAVAFSALNLVLIARRIALEDRALAPRRAL